jgi:hypothetical protein
VRGPPLQGVWGQQCRTPDAVNAHYTRCVSHYCLVKRDTSCAFCVRCCTLEKCTEHKAGASSMCVRCRSRGPLAGCTDRRCAGCGKDGAHAKACSAHGALCTRGACPSRKGLQCADKTCRGCCRSPWCADHGDARLCHGCGKQEAAGKCNNRKCTECCRQSTAHCTLHGTRCVMCRDTAPPSCAGGACRAHCEVAWCRSHGDPSLCHTSMCGRAADSWCTESRCAQCCGDEECQHSFCLRCTSPLTDGPSSKCPHRMCGQCCQEGPGCEWHGSKGFARKNVMCNGCQYNKPAKWCVSGRCGQCCIDNRCAHRKCTCGNVASSTCKKCAACCTRDDCARHRTLCPCDRFYADRECPNDKCSACCRPDPYYYSSDLECDVHSF